MPFTYIPGETYLQVEGGMIELVHQGTVVMRMTPEEARSNAADLIAAADSADAEEQRKAMHMSEHDLDTLKDVIANPDLYGLTACAICGEKPAIVGVFTPKESFAKRIGQPAGKHRVVAYALCDNCCNLPDRDEQVERRMIKDLGVQ